jgi:hypothetical protein
MYIGSDDDGLNEITIELLDIMCRGQLLPAPLNYISKMIPHLKPNEVYFPCCSLFGAVLLDTYFSLDCANFTRLHLELHERHRSVAGTIQMRCFW